MEIIEQYKKIQTERMDTFFCVFFLLWSYLLYVRECKRLQRRLRQSLDFAEYPTTVTANTTKGFTKIL